MKRPNLVSHKTPIFALLPLAAFACSSAGDSTGTGATGLGAPGTGTDGTSAGTNPDGTLGGTGTDPVLFSDGAELADGEQETCIEVVQGFETGTPTVLILVDQSASMNEIFDLGKSRWQTVRDTLLDPASGIVTQLEADVRFGLSIYTAVTPNQPPEGFVANNFEGGCPLLVNSPIGFNSSSQMSSIYPTEGVGHTPTGESIQAATATLQAFTEPGPKAIVLATDGDPDNCMDGNANTPNNIEGQRISKQISVDAVSDAFSKRIKTYVISVGFDATQEHLKELAATGQGDSTAVPYTANSAAQLAQAFSDIVNGVRACTFTLHGSVPADHAQNGAVTLNGQPLAFNDPNGWVLANESTVELKGTACQAVLSEDLPEVNITFPCIPVVK